MGIVIDRGRWYFQKRVPKRFQHIDGRGLVRIALRTDSKVEAVAKAPQVEREVFAYWEALDAGRDAGAAARYDAAVRLAQIRGFAYRSTEEIAAGPLDDLMNRLEVLLGRDNTLAEPVEIAAVLGAVAPPVMTISEAMDDFFTLAKDRLLNKSPAQAKRYETSRRLSVRNFAEVVGDKPLAEITRADAVAFRSWWQERVAEGRDPATANKHFGHLSDLMKTIADLRAIPLENPFANLRLKTAAARDAFPFSAPWIKTRLLAPGALDGLGQEARDVLLVMVNTGARPSEILGALAEDFAIGATIPHLRIRAREGRTLKTDHSRRDVPLLGVSLAAATRLAEAGGAVRYAHKGNVWSATVNKFLTEHGLRETPQHTAYGLRHSFEDRLLEAGVDDRIRAELMGHKYARPKYGVGGALETKRDMVARIAI